MAKKEELNTFDDFQEEAIGEETEIKNEENENPYLKSLEKMGQKLEEGFKRYEQKVNRDKFDDINDRVTILLNKNLHEQLNNFSSGNRGLKSELINIAVDMIIASGIAEQKAKEYREKKKEKERLLKKLKNL